MALSTGWSLWYVLQKLCHTLTMDLLYANQMMHCAFSCTFTIILATALAVLTVAESVLHMCMEYAQKNMRTCLFKKTLLIHAQKSLHPKLYTSFPMTLYIFWFQKCLYFHKNKLTCIYAFWGYIIFLLPLFRKFLEQNRHFIIKMDSEVHDSFIG